MRLSSFESLGMNAWVVKILPAQSECNSSPLCVCVCVCGCGVCVSVGRWRGPAHLVNGPLWRNHTWPPMAIHMSSGAVCLATSSRVNQRTFSSCNITKTQNTHTRAHKSSKKRMSIKSICVILTNQSFNQLFITALRFNVRRPHAPA